MAIKGLIKPASIKSAIIHGSITATDEKKVQKFIDKGGSTAKNLDVDHDDDHRLTLRIPKWLLEKVDIKRKERIGTISRNLWILELIDKATRK